MLSLGRFVLGSLELALVVGAAWLGASAVRSRVVPMWRGVVTHVADAVVALSLLVVVGEVLGTFGLFREWLAVLTVVASGVALRLLLAVPATQKRVAGTARTLRWEGVVAIGAVAITVGQWVDRIGGVLDGGITSFDSLHYHLPFAARFAQTGSTAHIQLLSPEFPDAYHHANAELLHAYGMLFFHRDVLSVFFNLAFVALAVAAAYCVGDRWDQGPLGVIAVCVVLASPLMGLHHAGTASLDVVVLAFVLCSAAMLVVPDRTVAGFALVGLAAGMAFGTKLTAFALAAALVVAVPFLARRGSRMVSIAWAALFAAIPSAYWLVRDFVDTGNPAPGVNVPLFTSDSFRTLDDLGYSIAHYATSTDVWRDWFFPGLRIDLGRAWPLVLIAVLAGILAALVTRDGSTRALGVVAGVGCAVYLVTPTTALGPQDQPLLFASNVRYAAPAVALGLVLLASPPISRRTVTRWITAGVLFAVLVVAQFSQGPFPGWPTDHRNLGFLFAAAVVLLALLAFRARKVALAIAALVIVVGGYPLARHYDEQRYASDPVAQWASSVHDVRIAIAGFEPQFNLYGRDLSNHVQYVGERGPHGGFHESPSCTAWRRSLRDGGYQYVVVSPQLRDAAAHEVAWTASDPAASVVLTTPLRTVYRFDSSVADPGCPT